MSLHSLAAPLVLADTPKLHWIARLSLPQPSVVLLLFSVLTLGSLCCPRSRTVGLPKFDTGSTELAVQPQAASLLETGLALPAVALVVVFLVASQLICEQAVKQGLRRVRGSDAVNFPNVTAGPLQSCFFLGTFEWRNCSVQNPSGYKSDSFIHVGMVKAKVNLARFLLSRGRDLVLQELILDDLTVNLEPLPGHAAALSVAEDHSNITDTIRCLDQTKPSEVAAANGLILKKVDASRCKVNLVGGHLIDMPSLRFDDFSGETGTVTSDRCFSELLKVAGRAALTAAKQ